ncbi:hypothetical protein B0H19DRAFT_1272545 [Mycena capillaripes]|nr:hypothetical protein B0H19DRAFT_1272463 [Mycena capillaripes]KAJ6533141.1 hypothetical protein B0H19DRAFT_1272545 [Mycena capillaripes]
MSANSHTHFFSFVCTAGGFAGTCGKFHGASGQCVDFLSQFNDEISAIGPDSGQDCFFYLAFNCSSEQLGPIRNPGISNLNSNGFIPFNNQISSFK